MSDFQFYISNDVKALGVKNITARIGSIKNSKSGEELDRYLQQELEQIKKAWAGKTYKDNAVLSGFRDLHTKVGRSNKTYPASPEVLLRLLLETGRFPRINAIVDLYNLVSLKTRLALGAHDMNHIEGNVTLRMTTGTEKFIPLGKKESVTVPAGEYSYIDDGNNIICRMEVLQVEPTKITLDTDIIFLIVQGNAHTESLYVEHGAQEVIELFKRFCGASDIVLL